jgi:P pilus assembly chaperone PapD
LPEGEVFLDKNLGKRRKIFIIIYGLFFFFVSAAALEAATVRINPTKVRLIIPAGGAKTGNIEVDNPSDESIIVKSYLEDWFYTSQHNGTKNFFPAGTTSLSCSDWITTSLSEFVIPPFAKQTIQYTVRVPEEASGGHYAVLFFESLLAKPDITDTAQLGVVVRIGALFYIETKGTTKREAEIANLTLKRESPDGPLKMSLDFKNTGNVDITCAGTFHIMDNQGMIFSRGELDNVYLFPKETAKLTSSWKGALSKGQYSLVVTIDIGKALEEAQLGRGPVIIKEVDLEIGGRGEVLRIGELR